MICTLDLVPLCFFKQINYFCLQVLDLVAPEERENCKLLFSVQEQTLELGFVCESMGILSQFRYRKRFQMLASGWQRESKENLTTCRRQLKAR